MTEQTEDVVSIEAGETGGPGRTLRFADFVNLYTRPRLFFAGGINLADKRFLLPVAWVLGISAQFDRLDTEIMRNDLGETRSVWRVVEPLVTDGWFLYWTWCLGLGVIAAFIVYFVGGWWYRMRLRFSGAKDLDTKMPRYLNAYSSFVLALAGLLLTIGYTLVFPNYIAAYNSDEMVAILLPVFIFWSVAVSYIGATEVFSVSRSKARFWFLILPVAFYIILLGGVVWLFTLFQ